MIGDSGVGKSCLLGMVYFLQLAADPLAAWNVLSIKRQKNGYKPWKILLN